MVILALLLLAGGAVVNVAVAWGCVYFNIFKYSGTFRIYEEDGPDAHPERHQILDWATTLPLWESEMPFDLLDAYVVKGVGYKVAILGEPSSLPEAEPRSGAARYESGWPLSSFTGHRVWNWSALRDDVRGCYRLTTFFRHEGYAPFHPMALGFVLNTLVYALLLVGIASICRLRQPYRYAAFVVCTLILGSVASLLVAAGAALAFDREEGKTVVVDNFPSVMAPRFTKPDVEGVRIDRIRGFGADEWEVWAPSSKGRIRWFIGGRTAGLPLRCLAGAQSSQDDEPIASAVYIEQGSLLHKWTGCRFLPTTLIVPGFIINTVFYALLLWLLFVSPFSARRMLRRRRGQCEKCAYPIGVSPVCTECGAAVRCTPSPSGRGAG